MFSFTIIRNWIRRENMQSHWIPTQISLHVLSCNHAVCWWLQTGRYHFHLIHRPRHYYTAAISFHLHAVSIFFVSGIFIDCTSWSVNIRIAEKQIVSAPSKYCNGSWYNQRKNTLIYQRKELNQFNQI